MNSDQRRVILYELNEVPWKVVDYYLQQRPLSNLAELTRGGQSLTSRHDDGVFSLSPWRTWPTFHNSTYDHNSFDLGQDPKTFKGEPIWDVAERAGRSVGLFGPMQSWPPRQFQYGGFFVPDTFSQDSSTFPKTVQRFQRFNLGMTRENGFSADAPLSGRVLAAAGVDMVRNGLTLRSAGALGAHLAQEMRDRRYKARRPVMQALPSFDLYWRLHLKHRPDLSIFFTNHVASMMHRFWGDALPEYAEEYGYSADEVFRGFLMSAMDHTDRHLGRIRKFMVQDPKTVLIIAASMGQGPIEKKFVDQEGGLYTLKDHSKLLSCLGLDQAEAGLAMHPYLSLVFATEAAAERAVDPLQSVSSDRIGRIFPTVRREGRSVAYALTYNTQGLTETSALSIPLSFRRAGSDFASDGNPTDLGLAFRPRLGGANTAYHIPEGILIASGRGIASDSSREEVDILDVAPSILANILRIDPSPEMRGTPTLFV